MNVKKLKILGIIIAFIICFPLHFLYDKIPSFTTSIIAPVNESIAEHMKILFTSILISGVIQKIIVNKKKLGINNVCISNFSAALLSIPIFLIMFLPIYSMIGENLIVNIILMLIAIVIAEFVSYKIMKMKNLKLENVAIFLTIIVYLIFGTFTYNTPKTEFFRDPITNIYGIKK